MNEKIFYSEYFYQKGPKDTEILEKNANEFSFSSLASFMLLYHYKKLGHPSFEKMASKTALLFNNPHWLRFQLSEIPDPSTAKRFSEAPQKEAGEPENFAPEPVASRATAIMETAPGTAGKIEAQEVAAFTPQDDQVIDNNDKAIVAPANFNVVDNSNMAAAEVTNDNTPPVTLTAETPVDAAEQRPVEPEVPLQELSPAGELAELPSSHTPTAVTDGKQSMVFEPLHTVDYFASQGIRINDDLVTTDKLSNQLKSFTAWLRTMKKIHATKLPDQGFVNEHLIQSAANASNINTEVLTEAMAEVLIKQDKKDKAIEMFTKLSLINPAKSAYFAARIESIKSN